MRGDHIFFCLLAMCHYTHTHTTSRAIITMTQTPFRPYTLHWMGFWVMAHSAISILAFEWHQPRPSQNERTLSVAKPEPRTEGERGAAAASSQPFNYGRKLLKISTDRILVSVGGCGTLTHRRIIHIFTPNEVDWGWFSDGYAWRKASYTKIVRAIKTSAGRKA